MERLSLMFIKNYYTDLIINVKNNEEIMVEYALELALEKLLSNSKWRKYLISEEQLIEWNTERDEDGDYHGMIHMGQNYYVADDNLMIETLDDREIKDSELCGATVLDINLA